MVQIDFDLVVTEPAEGVMRMKADHIGLNQLGWPPVAEWLSHVKVDLNQCPGDFPVFMMLSLYFVMFCLNCPHP